MYIERKDKPPIIIGNRIAIGQIIGASCAWGFWLGEVYGGWQVPAAMVTQATTLLIGVTQMVIVNYFGVTTGAPPDDKA